MSDGQMSEKRAASKNGWRYRRVGGASGVPVISMSVTPHVSDAYLTRLTQASQPSAIVSALATSQRRKKKHVLSHSLHPLLLLATTSMARPVPKAEMALLLRSLRDPMAPDSCCAIVMKGVSQQCFLQLDTGGRAKFAPLLRALVQMLTKQRTEPEFHALYAKLTTCTCPLSVRRMNCHGLPVEALTMDDMLGAFLWEVCGQISNFVNHREAGKYRHTVPGLSPDEQPWPSNAQDIIHTPGAEFAVLVSLQNWFNPRPAGYGVFTLIAAFATFHSKFAETVFKVPLVFRLALQHIVRISEQPGLQTTGPLNKRCFTLWAPLVSIIVGFISGLRRVEHTFMMEWTVDNIAILAKAARKLLPVVKREIRHHAQLPDCVDFFEMVLRLNASIGPDGTINVPEVPPTIAAYHGAYVEMAEVRLRSQCLFVNCPHDGPGAATDRATQVCSGCGVVRYCSKDCLRAAWTDSALPHKPLCKAIKQLRAATHLTSDAIFLITLRKRDAAAFVAHCTQLGIDSTPARAVGDRMTALKKAKLEANEKRWAAEGGGCPGCGGTACTHTAEELGAGIDGREPAPDGELFMLPEINMKYRSANEE
ncbi:MYND-type domain-containing protein [Mycena indigotica]|uniref:MYND-type domain-containing protein n=1 Tax=Mycena indigotica TaxID=2126181 RepID=A0A8H6S0K1_9AGAR|nr:MYND-type domain-containing protein [Mycena indigotica]KAF7290242.1 MYND-type domain-containing protein [Mycena indigotica]